MAGEATPLYHYADATGWQRLWRALAVAPAPASWAALRRSYQEPQRAYHTLTHIDECLAHFATVHQLAESPAAVEAAIWFHDLIYDPRRSDNEAASARWTAALLQSAALADEMITTIVHCIEDTAHRHPPRTADSALLVDIDLAILGAPPERFATYETQIRHEYNWVPWPTYCQRRSALLRQFLDRRTIYQTAEFQARFEDRARKNLAQSIQQLTAPSAVTR